MTVLGIGISYGIATLVAMFSGMPIAFALGAVAVVFMGIYMPAASLDTVTQNVYEEMASITLLSIPLFILKGAAIGKSRAGQDLYSALHAWLHRVPGGLGVANVFACALFAAMAGSSPATCSAIGSAGIPEMRKRGYSGGFAAGIIAAGGTLGILLPPSITMILFAVEWRWVRPDPGWGAWLAGVTFTVAFSLLIKHDRDLLRRLRQAQAGLAEQAKTQERNRIARELHDVIGHTLTVSLLHVQSARLAVEHDPADAARALAEAERLGRECLAEVRSTVGLLRQDRPAGGTADDPASTASNAPLPGADGLPVLMEQFRSAGADVTLTVEGDAGLLPATTGLAVYRIVQEALTNAAKHAPGSPTTVRLTVGSGEVTLTADSQAVPGAGHEPGAGNGLGLASMRERAESLGGSCQAGPGGRGWLVRATLPLSLRAAP